MALYMFRTVRALVENLCAQYSTDYCTRSYCAVPVQGTVRSYRMGVVMILATAICCTATVTNTGVTCIV